MVFVPDNAGKDYKAKYRSLIFNLRDDNNPDLRRRVLLGDIPAEKLVTLTHQELASKVTPADPSTSKQICIKMQSGNVNFI